MSHLISSCHMLDLASDCEGSDMDPLVCQGVLHVPCIQVQPRKHESLERIRHHHLVHLEKQVVAFP